MQLPFELDDNENALLFNTEIFPMKRKITAKLFGLFEHIKQQLKDTPEHKQFHFPIGTDSETGKISQGENYVQFPWVMLDFPKCFTRDNIFAFRSMCWYGHYYHCALLLGGESVSVYLPKLIANKQMLHNKNFQFFIGEDPWEHAAEGNHLVTIDTLTALDITAHSENLKYIKIARILQSGNAASLTAQVVENYSIILNCLS